jgi:hypothetical protein
VVSVGTADTGELEGVAVEIKDGEAVGGLLGFELGA